LPEEEDVINGINTRELILEILLEIEENGQQSHRALGNALSKYQFLPKQDRAFITRVCEGTLEYRIQIDYILNSFSKVSVDKMKPVIREILRSAVYQLKYMDGVPDRAVCDEAVKLAQKKGFYNLKPFVNGVLRTAARQMDEVVYPSREDDLVRYLSVRYSMPENLVIRWLKDYGEETTEKILADFLTEKPTTVRCRFRYDQQAIYKSLVNQGVEVEQAPYLPYAYQISKFNHIYALDAFVNGKIQVQDVSSMLVAEVAGAKKGDYVIDMCAAPGGKSLHIGDKMEGFGTVDARDLTQYKVDLIEENITRTGSINVQAKVQDATVFDLDSEFKADIVLADVPCSGYGVIGKKPEIKYRVTPQKQEEIVILQRTILDRAAHYVKPRGTLMFSTCTIAKEENEENMMWFLNNYPFKLESLDPYLPEELHSETTALGYLQLLPGVHKTDGFFIAKFRRK
jgi:16S rRNA (cytosine967-C5)-methyltransferase